MKIVSRKETKEFFFNPSFIPLNEFIHVHELSEVALQ
jgi:hypothetical protein